MSIKSYYEFHFLPSRYTHGDKKLHTLLVKYFNDLLDGQKSQRSIDKVTYFYFGDLFCIHLGTKYANFQEKIFADISGRKLQTLYSSNVTTIQSLQFSPRNICKDFFLKIGILCAKVYTKKVPNIEVCNFINAPLRLLSMNMKQVIEVLY